MAASIALASCSNEEVVELNNGNAIDFRASMGDATRATETVLENLNEFNVTALMGADNYFTNILFEKDGSSFKSKTEYLWPGTNTLDFYAYAPISVKDLVTINGTTQTIAGFAPAATVADQIDLITAYNTGSKANEASGVPLEFKHALCQIDIKAFTNSEVYYFDVKGVKISTVNSKGTLNMNESRINWSYDNDEATSKTAKGDYVINYDNAIRLTKEVAGIAATEAANAKIMILPQQLTKWDHKGDENNANNGAYLAVLLKITTKEGLQIYPKKGTVTEGVNDYAWACVPIDTKWEAGFRYTYTLDFSKGAGQVPPTDPEIPGDDILGGPITFTAKVAAWEDPTNTEIDMNGSKVK